MESAPLIPVEPPTSIKLDAFLRNREQRFLSLPAEIRFAIYKHAVMELLPICPMQVADGSNKFVWGRYRKVGGKGREGGSALEPAEKALTITQLTRTSRQIYLDLAADPSFYRSNVFSFRDPHQLHFFLAALMPERRRAIRNIRVHEVRHSPSSHEWAVTRFGSVLSGDRCRHLFTLLRGCRDLRRVVYLVSALPFTHPRSMATATRTNVGSTSAAWRPAASRARSANTVAETSAILRAVVPRARSAIRLDSPSLWDLPGFAIALNMGDFNEVVIELGEDAPEEALPRRFRERRDFVTVLREAETAFRDYQLRLQERRKRNPRTHPTDWEVYNATRGAGLDFPGDIRINQKGTPRGFETIPRHAAEGVLAWQVYRVRDVRRKGPVPEGRVLECLVEFADQGLSWEEARRLASWRHLCFIRSFYEELFRGEGDPRERLQAIERTPKPEEVKDALGDLVDSAPPYNGRSYWKEMTREREWAVRRLKRRVEHMKLNPAAEARGAEKQGTSGNASTEWTFRVSVMILEDQG
ncbi:hypothetical protein DL764_002521 [Monosporascus ibericus]|uniref:DUF7730 domain-containing protein n=1 Tax=Monosporascus ibericus TaxID=155417 RepID=A0A4Q4TJY7_9PEZI|nr:hypothetical protein DL764_002521 [Monosporascus ibericus]